MKVRFAAEAFALALVFFTTGLEIALVAGAVLVAGTVLGDPLAEAAGKTAAAAIAFIGTGALLCLALVWTGFGSDFYLGACMVGMLVGKHVYDGVEGASTGEILKQNYIALAVMAVIAVCRELLSKGALFGYGIGSFSVISNAYSGTAFGLIFGGLGIAAVYALLKKENGADSLWIAVPVAVMMTAASFGSDIMPVVKAAVAAAIAVVLLVGIRKKMIFSRPGKYFAGLSVEMISLGFLTMMLSVIG